MHLSSISSLIAKGLNTYVNVIFLFLYNTFAKMFKKNCFRVVIMGYCVEIAEDLFLFNPF